MEASKTHKTGDIKLKEGDQRGYSGIIKVMDATILKFLEQNPNNTGANLARAWHEAISVP